MSVTFSVPDAPRLRVMCVDCLAQRLTGYADAYTDPTGRITCDKLCDGYTLESEAPEMNVANGNARILLDALGVDAEELGGTFAHYVLPDLIRGTVRVLNTQAPERLSESGGGDTCRVVDCGTSAAYIKLRIGQLQALFVYAAERGFDVHYG